jgi:hypothetical protein
MSRSAFTVKAFGVYVMGLGVVLILWPNLLLGLFGLPPTNEVWIRVVGVVAVDLGICYWYAAKYEAKALFLATAYYRVFVLAAFAAFAALGLVSPMLILFGAVDCAGGVWTFLALRAERGLAPA